MRSTESYMQIREKIKLMIFLIFIGSMVLLFLPTVIFVTDIRDHGWVMTWTAKQRFCVAMATSWPVAVVLAARRLLLHFRTLRRDFGISFKQACSELTDFD